MTGRQVCSSFHGELQPCPAIFLSADFLHRMRDYMPPSHRAFVEEIRGAPSLRTGFFLPRVPWPVRQREEPTGASSTEYNLPPHPALNSYSLKLVFPEYFLKSDLSGLNCFKTALEFSWPYPRTLSRKRKRQTLLN